MTYLHKMGNQKSLIEEIKERTKEVDKIKIISGYTTDTGLNQLIYEIGMKDFEEKTEYFLVGLLTEKSYEGCKKIHGDCRKAPCHFPI